MLAREGRSGWRTDLANIVRLGTAVFDFALLDGSG